jgi:nitroimidazol reductase NimA-like FMN-containing flavoprotein (pyridoxamine 5'-phosphate oxidase superfamily)
VLAIMRSRFPEDVTILDQSQCWELLRRPQVGRLAIVIADAVEIFPINFVVDHGTLVFRTGEGSKLTGARISAPVAFEIDGYSPDDEQAWSVIVKGSVHEIKVLYDMVDTFALPLWPWHAKTKNAFVRIIPEDISGRRFHVVDPQRWQTALTGVHPAAVE